LYSARPLIKSKNSMRKFLFERRFDGLLALSILFLLALQLLVTQSQLGRLRVEDLAESVRSPYWWHHRTVFNGVSSNFGYYSILAASYKVFGFSLFMAKWVRLALHLASLVALALLLRRWMGTRLALVPLWIAGLSPSWLYFNANQAQFGADLQFFPLVLLAATVFPLNRGALTFFSAAGVGLLFVWGSLVYPTTLFYFPLLLLWALWRWRRESADPRALLGLAAAFGLGFLFPIALAFLYVKDPQLLIHDPVFESGLFRGGGRRFTRQPLVILQNHLTVIRDLFVQGSSYYFSLTYVEFRNWFSRLGFSTVAIGSFWFLIRSFKSHKITSLLKEPRIALFLWLLGFALFFFHAPQLISTFPGLRRTTGVLFAYYGLVAFLWWLAFSPSTPRPARILLITGILSQLLGNAITYPLNLESFRNGNNTDANVTFFRTFEDPVKSLLYWEKETRNGRALRCEEFEFSTCRYPEIFAAIQGYRLWEGLPPAEVKAWDPYQKRERVLDISIWERNEWPNF